VATVTAVGYEPASVVLGPPAPAADLPAPVCITIPVPVPVPFISQLQEYLLVHGGDPVPDVSPVEGIGQTAWNAVRKSALRWQTARRKTLQTLQARKGVTVVQVRGELTQGGPVRRG
jgi:hypothetical protein